MAEELEGTEGSGDPSGFTPNENGGTLLLRKPIPFGKDTVISELRLMVSARAFKEFSLPMKEDGTIMFQPYALAVVGIKMAGQPAAIADKLDVRDMMELATAVMGFIGTGPKI
jgi:hypothetical protein